MSVETMDKLCFIYINCRSIRASLNYADGEVELMEKLMAEMLLNQEDDLVTTNNEEEVEEEVEDTFKGLEAFFNKIIAGEVNRNIDLIV